MKEKIMEKYKARMSGKHIESTPEEEVIMPVEAEPEVPHKKVNIDIAVED